MQLGHPSPLDVMAGLVPAIHAAPLQTTLEVHGGLWAWMPGTRPGMTFWGCKKRCDATAFRTTSPIPDPSFRLAPEGTIFNAAKRASP